MSTTKRIEWDGIGERFYETGVDHGVLYPMDDEGNYTKGVAWNGLTNVSSDPEGGEPSEIYADNTMYLSLMSVEKANGTIEAYTYPEEFEACDGTATLVPGVTVGQQTRTGFGFSYRTLLGNDVKATDLGYKIHLVYNAKAKPSSQSNETVNDSPEAKQFSWEYSTSPIAIPGHRPASTLTIDSTKVTPEKLQLLEDELYGTENKDPNLPSPTEVIALIGA